MVLGQIKRTKWTGGVEWWKTIQSWYLNREPAKQRHSELRLWTVSMYRIFLFMWQHAAGSERQLYKENPPKDTLTSDFNCRFRGSSKALLVLVICWKDSWNLQKAVILTVTVYCREKKQIKRELMGRVQQRLDIWSLDYPFSMKFWIVWLSQHKWVTVCTKCHQPGKLICNSRTFIRVWLYTALARTHLALELITLG